MDYEQFQYLEEQLNDLNLEQVEIPGDGDCFFNSMLHMLQDPTLDVQNLRNQVYNEARDNAGKYQAFFSGNYWNKIQALQKPGFWNDTLGDLVASMMSEALKRNVIILRGGAPSVRIPEDLSYPGEIIYLVHSRTMTHYSATRRRARGAPKLKIKPVTPEYITVYAEEPSETDPSSSSK